MSNDVRDFSAALRKLLARPELRKQFMEKGTGDQTRIELNISAESAGELRNVLACLNAEVPRADASGERESGPAATTERMREDAAATMGTTTAFLEESFRQLRAAYVVTLAMSVAVFLVGISFLVLA